MGVSEMGTSAVNKIDVLALDTVDFNEQIPMDPLAGITPASKQEAALSSLLASFIKRGRDQGAPLRTLILDDCRHIPEELDDLFTMEKGQAAIEIDTRSDELEMGGVWTGYEECMTRTEREGYYWWHLRDDDFDDA